MKAVIVGAGAQGRVALDLLRGSVDYDEIEFLDDNYKIWDKAISGVIVRGATQLLKSYDKNKFKTLVAIGNPVLRRKVVESENVLDSPFMRAYHPTAFVAASADVHDGTTVCAQAVVNSNAYIGKHVLINNNSVVEHDCRIGDYATVCPGAIVGGRVEVGENSFISMGAIILPRVKIGKNVVIAAGSVVTRDVGDYSLAMGSPARVKCEIDDNFDWQRLL